MSGFLINIFSLVVFLPGWIWFVPLYLSHSCLKFAAFCCWTFCLHSLLSLLTYFSHYMNSFLCFYVWDNLFYSLSSTPVEYFQQWWLWWNELLEFIYVLKSPGSSLILKFGFTSYNNLVITCSLRLDKSYHNSLDLGLPLL